MEKIHMIGTNHGNTIKNKRIVDITFDLVDSDQIYVERPQKNSNVETSFLKRKSKLDLSNKELIASILDCYAMKNIIEISNNFSEFDYAAEIAEKKEIPVINIDKNKEDLVRESFEEISQKELNKYICKQSKNLTLGKNINSIFYKYVRGLLGSNNREKYMVESIIESERKKNTLLFAGASHIEYIFNQLKNTKNFVPRVIWSEKRRGSKEELKEYISGNL